MTNIEKYIAFTKSVNDLPLFAQPFWLDSVANNWRVWHCKINGHDFFLPYVLEQKGPFCFVRNIIFTPYNAIYSAESINNQHVIEQIKTAFISYFKKYSIVELDIHFLFSDLVSQMQINRNFLHTNVLDTFLSEKELHQNCKPSLQRHLKFALKNIKISECKSAEVIYNLCSSTATHNSIKNIYSIKLLQTILDTLTKYNCGRAWQASDADGNVHAILLQVWDANASYCIIAASLYPNPMRGAMASLLWHALLHSKQLGIKWFDFEGSRIKGIDTFFKTFGAIEKPVIQLKINNSIAAKLLLKIKNKLG